MKSFFAIIPHFFQNLYIMYKMSAKCQENQRTKNKPHFQRMVLNQRTISFSSVYLITNFVHSPTACGRSCQGCPRRYSSQVSVLCIASCRNQRKLASSYERNQTYNLDTKSLVNLLDIDSKASRERGLSHNFRISNFEMDFC